jgi:hypothetical protein
MEAPQVTDALVSANSSVSRVLHPPAPLQECMVACQEAEECEGFVINEVLAQCFLKKEQCPSYNFW